MNQKAYVMNDLSSSRKPTKLSTDAINEISEANNRLVTKNRILSTVEDLIEIKKNRSRREGELRPVLLNLGMIISLSLVILAINWKTEDLGEIVDLGKVEMEADEIIDIPISNQPPPPPVKHQTFKIEEVKDTEIVEELEVTLDVEVTQEESIEEIEYVPVEIEEEVVEEIFVVVETPPTPKGGIDEFYKFLSDELKYPSQANRLGISGTVFVQFVIEKDGSFTDIEVVKGIGAGCDKEAIRVIGLAPAWNPGKQRGKPVRVRKIIPVRFILQTNQ